MSAQLRILPVDDEAAFRRARHGVTVRKWGADVPVVRTPGAGLRFEATLPVLRAAAGTWA